ncbi:MULTISPECIES: adenylate kinase [Arthrobacter]|uniref:Adenylate kinase n=2 Tax=Arthrobacter TaxID=1663 RepID=A0ABU9KPD1_9MICC|nr:adenylate kinase [Arthrobacter sp. YJM1]MDP5228712.1 adenylate kinase [Arthrobacter sp. YJM1]
MSHAGLDTPLPRRILLHGVTGTGKTTTANRLSELAGIPWHSADDEIGWMPAADAPWTNRAPEEMRAIAAGICAQDDWILDSAYGHFTDLVLARAELVVGLDYSRLLTFLRLLRRTIHRIRSHESVCNGNVETLRQALSRDSILIWHLTSFRGKRARLHAWAADPSAPPVLILKSPAELESWLGRIALAATEHS